MVLSVIYLYDFFLGYCHFLLLKKDKGLTTFLHQSERTSYHDRPAHLKFKVVRVILNNECPKTLHIFIPTADGPVCDLVGPSGSAKGHFLSGAL